MQGLSRQERLADLRDRIENIEKRPPLENADPAAAGQGLLAAPSGLLHEVFADDQRSSGAALGFALGQARQLLSRQRPAVLILQLDHDGQPLGVPYGAGLASAGLDPSHIVMVRPETPVELLWAMEEALACRAVAAVIADIATPMKSLDFTASRRLGLRTAASGSSALIVRYTREREASAARLRWRVASVPGPPRVFDSQAPGGARWQVQLEKGRLGSRREPQEWIVDWTGDGFVAANREVGSPTATAARSPLSRPLFAALGDRLSEAG